MKTQMTEDLSPFIVALNFQHVMRGKYGIAVTVQVFRKQKTLYGRGWNRTHSVELVHERRNHRPVKRLVRRELRKPLRVTGSESVRIVLRPGGCGRAHERTRRDIDRIRNQPADDFREVAVQKRPAVIISARTLPFAIPINQIELVRFIGSAPDTDAGMTAKAAHDLFRLAAALRTEHRIKFRNFRSAEHEILPDHDAGFITEVIKIIGFIITAAPDAQIVVSALRRKRDQMPQTLPPHGPGEHVGRNPVAAVREHGNAIDTELKKSLLLRETLLFNLKRTESEAVTERRDLPHTGEDLQPQLVKRLFPVSGRIPEFRRIHLRVKHIFRLAGTELDRIRGGKDRLSRLFFPNLQCGATVENIFQFRVQLKRKTNASVRRCFRKDFFRTGDRERFDADIPPDSARRQTVRPVPAVGIVGFASRAAHGGKPGIVNALAPVAPEGDDGGVQFLLVERFQTDDEFVFRVVAQDSRDRDAETAHHRFVRGKVFDVEFNFRNIGETVEHEIMHFIRGETAAEDFAADPLLLSAPDAVQIIHAVTGIFNQACGTEVVEHVSGDFGGNFLHAVGGKLPGSGKRENTGWRGIFFHRGSSFRMPGGKTPGGC